MTMLEEKLECWLVWERAPDAATGGRPYLRAVDLTEAQAEAHRRGIEEEAKQTGKDCMVVIEQSWVNHLYGETMTAAYDFQRTLMQELRDRAKGG